MWRSVGHLAMRRKCPATTLTYQEQRLLQSSAMLFDVHRRWRPVRNARKRASRHYSSAEAHRRPATARSQLEVAESLMAEPAKRGLTTPGRAWRRWPGAPAVRDQRRVGGAGSARTPLFAQRAMTELQVDGTPGSICESLDPYRGAMSTFGPRKDIPLVAVRISLRSDRSVYTLLRSVHYGTVIHQSNAGLALDAGPVPWLYSLVLRISNGRAAGGAPDWFCRCSGVRGGGLGTNFAPANSVRGRGPSVMPDRCAAGSVTTGWC